jgi:uncharacterized protein (DUF1501 family)
MVHPLKMVSASNPVGYQIIRPSFGVVMFMIGGKVKGGLWGAHPSLTDLEADSLKCHTDFRRVYATVLERWLNLKSEKVLAPGFAPLDGVLV